jgi:hypothetical protein
VGRPRTVHGGRRRAGCPVSHLELVSRKVDVLVMRERIRRDNLRRLARHGFGWDRPRPSLCARFSAWITRTLGLVRTVERRDRW